MRTKGLTFAIQDLEAHLIHSGLTATEQAQVIDHAFGGGRTSSAIMTLTQNADQLGTVLQRVNDGMGQFSADISDQKATDAAKFAEAQAQMAEASIKLGAAILPLITDVLPKLVAAVTALVNFFTALPGPVQNGVLIFIALFAALGPVLLVLGSMITVVGTLGTVFSALGTILAGTLIPLVALGAPIILLGLLIAALAYVVTTQWQNIKTGTQVLVDFLKSMWKQATDDINAFLTVVTNSVNAVLGFINSVKSAASGFASNVATGAAVVSHAIVPHLASGGIVTGPTLALIGEAGPEAVVPLSGSGAFGGGGGINITITGNTISNQLDIRSIASAVGDEIVRVLRQNQKLAI